MIKFIAANKWFGKNHILKNINLEIANDEILEIGTPPDIFVNPQHPRTKDFMSSVFHIPVFDKTQEEEE